MTNTSIQGGTDLKRSGCLTLVQGNRITGWVRDDAGASEVEILVNGLPITCIEEQENAGMLPKTGASGRRGFILSAPAGALNTGDVVEARFRDNGQPLEGSPWRNNLTIIETGKAADKGLKSPRKQRTLKRMRKAYAAVAADPGALARCRTFTRMVAIVGAMKSGTTGLHRILASHPEIVRNALVKEPEFFARWNQDERKLPELAAYFAQYPFKSRRHRYALDGSTSYSKTPAFSDVYSRMRESGVEFKFIYILRDPLDRLESHVKHSIANGRFRLGSDPLTRLHVATSSYAQQLDELTRYYPRESVLLLSFNEFIAEPQQVTNRVLAFLELSPFDVRKAEPLFKRLRERLLALVRGKSTSKYEPRNVRKLQVDGQDWSLDEATRRRAYELLKPDVERLASVYGVDVDTWFKRVAGYRRADAAAGTGLR